MEYYYSGSRARCPSCAFSLADLLGQNHPWVDVHRSQLLRRCHGPTTIRVHQGRWWLGFTLSWPTHRRCVRAMAVRGGTWDSGHQPVLVTPFCPHLPPLLHEPSWALATSSLWSNLMENRRFSPQVLASRSLAGSLDSSATGDQFAVRRWGPGWRMRPPPE